MIAVATQASKRKRGRSAQWPRPSEAAMRSGTLGYWGVEYARWLLERNYSERTSGHRREYLMHFAGWCEQRGLLEPLQITKPILERYQRVLFEHRQQSGKPLSFSAQFQRLSTLRVYFRWLTRQNVIDSNPASELELPRQPHHLPRYVLTVHEVESILALPDIADVLGLRDRAMMEVLYATGIRRSEIVQLRIFDVDVGRGTLFVRQGKGQRDRIVPLGERALLWIEKYLGESRPALVLAIDEGALFLTSQGEPMTLMRASDLVRGYVQASGIGKKGACHLFRHTAATLMLENGADIRYIQHLLGHAELSTTQIYTQVSIHKLMEVHARTHPGARLAPVREDGRAREDVVTDEESKRDELVSLLAAEVEDEREELGEREEHDAARSP